MRAFGSSPAIAKRPPASAAPTRTARCRCKHPQFRHILLHYKMNRSREAAMSLKLNSLKAGELDGYSGQGPDEFCNTGLTTRDQNHCAHFVCHALEFNMREPLCGD